MLAPGRRGSSIHSANGREPLSGQNKPPLDPFLPCHHPKSVHQKLTESKIQAVKPISAEKKNSI